MPIPIEQVTPGVWEMRREPDGYTTVARVFEDDGVLGKILYAAVYDWTQTVADWRERGWTFTRRYIACDETAEVCPCCGQSVK